MRWLEDVEIDLRRISLNMAKEGSCQRRMVFFFNIHGSVNGESNLITVQQDATYSVYYISVGCSTCFGC